MFNNNFNLIQRPNPLDTYSYIENQFINIKNLHSLINYTLIPSNDLVNITNVITDCLDKLSTISAIYIKKLNDNTLNKQIIKIINKMISIHDNLVHKINDFGMLSKDLVSGLKEIVEKKFCQDIINYIYYDIINRYKLIIMSIFEQLKKLSVYTSIVKEKFY
jgi:hypothetical protein